MARDGEDEPSTEGLRAKRLREKLLVVMLVGDDADSSSASCTGGSDGLGSGICEAALGSWFMFSGGSCGVAARVEGDWAWMETFVFTRESGETERMGGRGDEAMVANGRLRDDGPEEALGGRPSASGYDGGR